MNGNGCQRYGQYDRSDNERHFSIRRRIPSVSLREACIKSFVTINRKMYPGRGKTISELAPPSFPPDLLVKVFAMLYRRAAPSLRADIPVEVVSIPQLGSAGGFFPSLYSTWVF